MLQLYGNARSRAMRCLWMLEEMGEPYRLIEKSTRADDLQSTEYLRLNPNARIPTLVDGDVVARCCSNSSSSASISKMAQKLSIGQLDPALRGQRSASALRTFARGRG
jgi:hypothetical protein